MSMAARTVVVARLGMGAHSGEGIDQHGFIVSGADVDLIPALYRPALETCVSKLVATVDGLVAVYLYGSVATGRASAPESDVDLLVVTREASSSDAIDVVGQQLSAQYRHLVRDVGVAQASMSELFADDIDALGERCFIKHYCVPLQGHDIRAQLPSYRPSATMAWAFNHNVASAVEQARQRLELADNSDDVKRICRAAARKVLFAAASLTSVITSTWTTDRRRAADTIAEHYPQWATQAATALAWGSSPIDDPSTVRAFLDGFATWVAEELHHRAAPR